MTSCLSPGACGRLKGTVSPKIIGIKNFPERSDEKIQKKLRKGNFRRKLRQKNFRRKLRQKKAPENGAFLSVSNQFSCLIENIAQSYLQSPDLTEMGIMGIAFYRVLITGFNH